MMRWAMHSASSWCARTTSHHVLHAARRREPRHSDVAAINRCALRVPLSDIARQLSQQRASCRFRITCSTPRMVFCFAFAFAKCRRAYFQLAKAKARFLLRRNDTDARKRRRDSERAALRSSHDCQQRDRCWLRSLLTARCNRGRVAAICRCTACQLLIARRKRWLSSVDSACLKSAPAAVVHRDAATHALKPRRTLMSRSDNNGFRNPTSRSVIARHVLTARRNPVACRLSSAARSCALACPDCTAYSRHVTSPLR